MVKEAWIAFILLCHGQTCDGTKTYSDKAEYSLELCRSHAYGWAVQMFALRKETYGFGCEQVTYIPPEIKAK